MTEVWKPVPSEPMWEASSHGRVRRVPFVSQVRRRVYGGTPMIGTQSSGAKMKVMGQGRNFAVHRLVCEAFHGPPPADRPVCMHLDENFRNNRPENLRWGTQAENMRAPNLRAFWTPDRQAAARRKAWETRRSNMEASQ